MSYRFGDNMSDWNVRKDRTAVTLCKDILIFFIDARFFSRSGISWKHHLDIGCGVCDIDSVGPIGVIIFNHSPTDFKVAAGDRVAKLILQKIANAEVVEVEYLGRR